MAEQRLPLSVDERIEQHNLWWAFHKHLMIEIFEVLRDGLGDEYLVDLESEILLVPKAGPTRSAAPDVTLSATPSGAAPSDTPKPTLTPALIEADEEVMEFEQYSVHIRRRDRPHSDDPFGVQVVSVLELLSPSNKGTSGPRDRQKFLAKRQDYLLSPVSYTEIDLLRGGERELPAAVAELADYPYIAWSSQWRPQARHYWGWGWQVEDPLPTIGVPLEHPHVYPLNLALCYQRAYERNRWPERLQLVEGRS